MIQLDQKYDREQLLGFLKEAFLKDFAKDVRPVGIDNFKAIKKAYTLGSSSDLDLQVFEFEYSGSFNKRIALAKEAFQVMKQSATFQALAIFYSPEEDDWRFSLMTANPQRTEKGNITVAYSNPRRYSFFLGSHAKTNTPTKFLIKKGMVVDFEDLKSRFSLEVVNKEFYKEIAECYTKLVGGTRGEGRNKKTYESILKLPSVNDHSQTSIEFAVRLIGRIIFCWFLREKISESGSSLMPKELLSQNAVSENTDYYHKILEPIFFEILNKNVKSRKPIYDDGYFSKIPYLNGGLFSPHDDDYFSYNEGKQAQNHNTVIIPDDWFNELFQILETYNFTIDENTSIDEELSIDPEMLGRIFENLLAEINPETGESARKSTGSYYTPRVIVDYMVDESLLLYLKQKTSIEEDKLRAIISYDLSDDSLYPLNETEKKSVVDAIERVKILDPACGSGAFPIGALQKIVFILQQIDPNGQVWFQKQIQSTPPEIRRVIEREFSHENFDYIRKLGIIRENIYGIDIQPIATEIARLRCFLTLVVDERIDEALENRGIQPLPNLDFKFVTANSLIGLPKLSAQGELFDDNNKIDELKELRDRYFNARDEERKDLMLAFSDLQSEMINALIDKHSWAGVAKAELTRKLTDWKPFKHRSTDWFDPEWMFGIKKGFDIIIANPPYVRHRDLNIEFKRYLKGQYSTGNTTSDLYCYFLELAYLLSSQEGITCFITSNKWLKAKYGQNIRKLIKNETNLKILIDLGGRQFEAATVDTSIVIFLKTENSNNAVKYGFLIPQNHDILNDIPQKNLDLNGFNLATSDDYSLKIKVEKVGVALSEWQNIKINYGVLTGKNEILQNNKREGVFIIDEEKRDKLIKEDKNSELLLKPILKGKDIGRYYVKWDQKYLVCVPYGFNREIDKYPAIKNHLEKYKQVLINRAQVKRGDHHWIELDQNPSQNFINEFSENKVIFPIISQGPKFHYDTEGFFHNDKAFHITGNGLKYLTAVLNSKLAYWMIKLYGPTLGSNGFEFRKIFVEQLRIPALDLPYQKPFVEIVDKILNLTKSNDYFDNNLKQLEVHNYEKQIDQMVYKLYGLTEDEIKIVELESKDKTTS